MVMSRVQKWILDKFLFLAIHKQVKSYIREGVHPTVEQVFDDINDHALNCLVTHDYDPSKIRSIIDNAIRRQECKE